MAKRSTNSTPKPRGRRKAKATKDETVDVRTVGIGDNSELKLPAPDDYEHHFKTIKGLMEKAATATSLVRHAKTAANKLCQGLADDITQTIAIEKQNDPVKLKRRLELRGIGLKHIGSSIQITVFDALAGEVEDQAYQRGFADGEAGKSANNRYPVGSSLAAAYTRGWNHGTGKNLGQTPEQVDAALAESEQAAA